MKMNEFGSDFHYFHEEELYLKEKNNSPFFGKEFSLFFSGRVALFNLLNYGIETHNWQKVFLPSFYCHEVTHFLKALPIEIVYYDFNPFLDSSNKRLEAEDSEMNVIINVDFYGLVKLDLDAFHRAIVIDDITHNIMGYKESTAHYCFGSLRKELPVPVGGFCFSPKGFSLPEGKSSPKADEVAIQKLSGMFLKKEFLEGKFKEKEVYRKLFIEAENSFEEDFTNASMPDIAKAILFNINVEALLLKKHQNIKAGLKRVKASENFKVNITSHKSEVFGLILKCKDLETRNDLRSHLIKRNVFPAVLWPNQIAGRDVQIENEILFLHMDYRYSLSDIEHIINKVNEFEKNE